MRSARCWISTRCSKKSRNLISRLTKFTVFSVYLLNEKREELSIAYAVGYPEEIVKHFTLQVGQGTVGTAVAEQRPILLNDVDATRATWPWCRARSRSWRCRCATRAR